MDLYELIQRRLSNFDGLTKAQQKCALAQATIRLLLDGLEVYGIVLVPETSTNTIKVVLNQSKHKALADCLPQDAKISVVWGDLAYPDLRSFDCEYDPRLIARLAQITVRANTLQCMENMLALIHSVGYKLCEVNTGYLLNELGNGSNYLAVFEDSHNLDDPKRYVGEDTIQDFLRGVGDRAEAMAEAGDEDTICKAAIVDFLMKIPGLVDILEEDNGAHNDNGSWLF